MNLGENQTCVVTGGASGIGLAVGRAALLRGMTVVLADVEERALQEAVVSLGDHAGRVWGMPVDVTSPESVAELSRRVELEVGKVHLLVNNAGVSRRGRAWDADLADWHWVMNVCFWGCVHGIQSFVPGMIRHGEPSHVVNTSSMLGMGAKADRAPYATAKQAVTALTEELFFDCRDLAPNVSVSLLCPGYTRTNIRSSARNHPTHPEAAAPSGGGEGGRDPAEIADLLLDGVESDVFYVMADEDIWLPVISSRFDAILQRSMPVPLVAAPTKERG